MHPLLGLHRIGASPRVRGVLFTSALLSLGIGASVVATLALVPDRATAPAPSAPPSQIAPAIPSVIVLPSPPAAEPTPPPAPAAPPAPVPHAIAPMLDASCLAFGRDTKACTWDDGFPAISDDGKTVVSKFRSEADGHPMALHFLDVATSRVTRTIDLVTPAEYKSLEIPDADDAHLKPALRAILAARITAVQHQLDRGRFRTLVALDWEPDAVDAPPRPTPMYAETFDDTARVIEAADARVVWQDAFPVELAFPPANAPVPPADDYDHARAADCYPDMSRVDTVSWDPPTRTIFARVSYNNASEECEDASLSHAREYLRVARVTR